MKLIIDISKEKYEWIKTHNLDIDNDSIVGAIANGTPYEERPTKEWKEWTDERWGGTTIYCPYCKEDALEKYSDGLHRQVKSHFCPNCGIKLEKGGAE